MTAQRVDINILDGLAVSGMLAVDAAPSLPVAEVDPIGGPVAGLMF